MFEQRHQLDVCEAQLLRVLREGCSDFPVGERTTGDAPLTLPGAEVDLVDAHRPLELCTFVALGHPSGVAPRMLDGRDDGRVTRVDLDGVSERIRLVPRRRPIEATDTEF